MCLVKKLVGTRYIYIYNIHISIHMYMLIYILARIDLGTVHSTVHSVHSTVHSLFVCFCFVFFWHKESYSQLTLPLYIHSKHLYLKIYLWYTDMFYSLKEDKKLIFYPTFINIINIIINNCIAKLA